MQKLFASATKSPTYKNIQTFSSQHDMNLNLNSKHVNVFRVTGSGKQSSALNWKQVREAE